MVETDPVTIVGADQREETIGRLQRNVDIDWLILLGKVMSAELQFAVYKHPYAGLETLLVVQIPLRVMHGGLELHGIATAGRLANCREVERDARIGVQR